MSADTLSDANRAFHAMNYNKAVKLYEKSCAENNAEGCFEIGRIYFDGQIADTNYKKAISYYEKACANGNTESCYRVGNVYYKGAIQKRDLSKALDRFTKACVQGNNAGGCGMLGTMSYKGEGTEKNIYAALELFKFASKNGDPEGINGLAQMLEKGEIIKADKNKAFRLYEKACKDGSDAACENLYRIQGK